MQACVEHVPVWHETAEYTGFACDRCMSMLPTANGRCRICGLAIDSHDGVVAGVLHCPPPKGAVK